MAISIPVADKALLTIPEAVAYSNIGINRLTNMLRQPDCTFVFRCGNRKLVKRKELVEFISEHEKID